MSGAPVVEPSARLRRRGKNGGPSRCRPLWSNTARSPMLLGLHGSCLDSAGASYLGGAASHGRVAGVRRPATALYHLSLDESSRCFLFLPLAQVDLLPYTLKSGLFIFFPCLLMSLVVLSN
jgi:hypothetical protein